MTILVLCVLYRFERLKSERTATNEEHLNAIRHMTLQNESVAATFKVSGYRTDVIKIPCRPRQNEIPRRLNNVR